MGMESEASIAAIARAADEDVELSCEGTLEERERRARAAGACKSW